MASVAIPRTEFERQRSELIQEIAEVSHPNTPLPLVLAPPPLPGAPSSSPHPPLPFPPTIASLTQPQSFEHVLANINKLNRNLEAVITVGNEFSSVEALWSTFENVMGKPAATAEEEKAGETEQQPQQEEGKPRKRGANENDGAGQVNEDEDEL